MSADLPVEAVQSDPPGPALAITREQILAALEQTFIVLRPGETLFVRVPAWLSPAQIHDYQRSINELCRYHEIPNHVVVLPGEQFVVARSSEIVDEPRSALDIARDYEAAVGRGVAPGLRPVPDETGPGPVQGTGPHGMLP